MNINNTSYSEFHPFTISSVFKTIILNDTLDTLNRNVDEHLPKQILIQSYFQLRSFAIGVCVSVCGCVSVCECVCVSVCGSVSG